MFYHMSSLAIYVVVLCGLAAIGLYLTCSRADREDARLLANLRQSAMYQRLHQQLSALKGFDIDQVRIEASGITVTSCCPAHTLLTFSFKQNGNSKRNDAYTRLYAQLIIQDFPLFAVNSAYKLRSYKVYRLNGKPEDAYTFTMRRGYKDFLLAERYPAQLRIY